jgi:hypothetical protein
VITSETRLYPTQTVQRKAEELGVSLDDVLNVVRQRDPTTWSGRGHNQVWYQGDTRDGRTINVLVEHRIPQYAPVVTVEECVSRRE